MVRFGPKACFPGKLWFITLVQFSSRCCGPREPVHAPPHVSESLSLLRPMCQKAWLYSAPLVKEPVYAPPHVSESLSVLCLMCQKACLYSIPCVRKPVYTPSHVSESLSLHHPMCQKACLYSNPCVRKPVFTLPQLSESLFVLFPMCQKACLCSIPCVRKPVYAPPHVSEGLCMLHLCQKTCLYSTPCIRKPVYTLPHVSESLSTLHPMCQKACLCSAPCVRKPVYTPPHVSESLSILCPMCQKACLYFAPCVRKPVYALPHVSESLSVLCPVCQKACLYSACLYSTPCVRSFHCAAFETVPASTGLTEQWCCFIIFARWIINCCLFLFLSLLQASNCAMSSVPTDRVASPSTFFSCFSAVPLSPPGKQLRNVQCSHRQSCKPLNIFLLFQCCSSLSSRQAIVQCPVFPQTELQAPQHFSPVSVLFLSLLQASNCAMSSVPTDRVASPSTFFSCFSALCTACYVLSVCTHLCESNDMSL